MTLYELNQAGYGSLARMSKSAIKAISENVSTWLYDQYHNANGVCYFALLNNELHYYTIFRVPENTEKTSLSIFEEILSVVKDIGLIKAIEKNDNGAWEFWVTNKQGSTNAYYLFNYNQGVIEL